MRLRGSTRIGTLALADFGTAKEGIYSSKHYVGTIPYMAPEVAIQNLDFDDGKSQPPPPYNPFIADGKYLHFKY